MSGLAITDNTKNNQDLGVGYAYIMGTDAYPSFLQWLRNDNEDYIRTNHVGDDGFKSTILGIPVIAADTPYVSFANSAYASNVKETADLTLVVVARSTDTNLDAFTQPRPIASQQGPAVADAGRTSGGTKIIFTGSTIYAQHATWDGASASTRSVVSPAVGDTNDWNLAVVRRAFNATTDPFKIDVFWNDGSPQTVSQTAVVGDLDIADQCWHVGNNSLLTAGDCDIAFAAIFPTHLSDADIATIVATLRADLARVGIIV